MADPDPKALSTAVQQKIDTGTGDPPPEGPAVTPAKVIAYDPNVTREKLAYFLLWIMIGIIAVFAILSTTYSVDCLNGHDAKCTLESESLNIVVTTLSPIFTAMVGLVGSVVGFYFGSKQG